MIAVQEDQLVCEVVDDGDGMNLEQNLPKEDSLPAPMSKRQLFSGIGIRNVDDRIKLMYGEKYGVHITSKRSEGTKIIITLPLTQS